MYEPFLSLLDIEVPVIGALNGHAVGGGFGLALVCDLRIGALEAKYGANFVALGLAPGMAISYLLPRLIGVARASELLLTGRLVDGAEAERIGIVNRAVPAAEVLAEAMAIGPRHRRQRAVRGARDQGRDPARPRLDIREAARAEARAAAEPDDGRRARGHRRAAREAQAGVHGPLTGAASGGDAAVSLAGAAVKPLPPMMQAPSQPFP